MNTALIERVAPRSAGHSEIEIPEQKLNIEQIKK